MIVSNLIVSLTAVLTPTSLSVFRSPILLYLGPETMLPLGSAIAAVIGLILIFWRFLFGFVRRSFYKLTGRPLDEPVIEEESQQPDDEVHG